jgi:hypothetical protein
MVCRPSFRFEQSLDKKWFFIKQVLTTKGRAEDVAQLDWEEVKRLLPELDLPENIKSLWKDYFDSQR